MTEDVVETFPLKDGRVLKIIQDTDPQDPRTFFDNVGIMVCWHRRYELGDEQPKESPDNWWEEHEKEMKVALPLRLYDHSGITMSIGSGPHPFDPQGWDSGQVGWIYTTKERILKILGEGKWTDEDIIEILTHEVKTYDQHLTNEVYGFTISKSEECNLGHDHEEVTDSCWGFYGHDWWDNGLMATAGVTKEMIG